MIPHTHVFDFEGLELDLVAAEELFDLTTFVGLDGGVEENWVLLHLGLDETTAAGTQCVGAGNGGAAEGGTVTPHDITRLKSG